MPNGLHEHAQVPDDAAVRCKPKHRALTKSEQGNLRRRSDVRSRCPGWLSNELQRKLMGEALVDPDAGTDFHGRPRLLWNAVNGWVFVGVSSSEPVPAYNCYPEAPTTSLVLQLEARAQRSIEDVLGQADGDGAP